MVLWRRIFDGRTFELVVLLREVRIREGRDAQFRGSMRGMRGGEFVLALLVFEPPLHALVVLGPVVLVGGEGD